MQAPTSRISSGCNCPPSGPRPTHVGSSGQEATGSHRRLRVPIVPVTLPQRVRGEQSQTRPFLAGSGGEPRAGRAGGPLGQSYLAEADLFGEVFDELGRFEVLWELVLMLRQSLKGSTCRASGQLPNPGADVHLPRPRCPTPSHPQGPRPGSTAKDPGSPTLFLQVVSCLPTQDPLQPRQAWGEGCRGQGLAAWGPHESAHCSQTLACKRALPPPLSTGGVTEAQRG